MYWLLFAASLVMPCIMLVLGLRWLGHPPASKNAPMLAAIPTQKVETSACTICIVS